MGQGEKSEESKCLCVLFPFFSLPLPSQALKVFQLKVHIGAARCGFRGSDSRLPVGAGAGLQDGARSQAAAAAAACRLPPRGC